MAASSSTKANVHWKSIHIKTWACDVLLCRLKQLLVYTWTQGHNYIGEYSSFFEPSAFKWLRTSENIRCESRHQEGKSQTPWKRNPFAWDRALCALPLRGQASWWDWSQDLLPPTLLPTGTVSVPVNQLATSASKPHYSVSELPAAQKVWSLVIHKTQNASSWDFNLDLG